LTQNTLKTKTIQKQDDDQRGITEKGMGEKERKRKRQTGRDNEIKQSKFPRERCHNHSAGWVTVISESLGVLSFI
jgi:hypothetical protein